MLYVSAEDNQLAPGVAELHMQNGEDITIIMPEGDERYIWVTHDGQFDFSASRERIPEDLGDYDLTVEWKGGYHGKEGDIGPRIKSITIYIEGRWPHFVVGERRVTRIDRTPVGIDIYQGDEIITFPWYQIRQVNVKMGDK